jgi:hypothetical protein
MQETICGITWTHVPATGGWIIPGEHVTVFEDLAGWFFFDRSGRAVTHKSDGYRAGPYGSRTKAMRAYAMYRNQRWKFENGADAEYRLPEHQSGEAPKTQVRTADGHSYGHAFKVLAAARSNADQDLERRPEREEV